jgi:hypothetical protein
MQDAGCDIPGISLLGTWVNRALETMSVGIGPFGERALALQLPEVFLGCFHYALPRSARRAEDRHGRTVVAAQHDEIGVRLVDEVMPWKRQAFTHELSHLSELDRCYVESVFPLWITGAQRKGNKGVTTRLTLVKQAYDGPELRRTLHWRSSLRNEKEPRPRRTPA